MANNKYWSPKYDWKDGHVDKDEIVHSLIDYQFCRTQSMFEYKGLPETVPSKMLERYLQFDGDVMVTKANGDLYAFFGNAGGVPDGYYMPTVFVISNPGLDFFKEVAINKDGVWGWNDSMRRGLLPMFRRYANAMADNEITMRVADICMRIPFVFTANDDNTKAAADLYIQKILQGDLSVVKTNAFTAGASDSSSMNVAPAATHVSSGYLSDLIEYQQYLKASWLNELGLNANYNMKRESINADEAQMNNDALLPLVDDMLRQRQELCERVNKMYETDWSVDLASSWKALKASIEAVDTEEELEGKEEEKDDSKPDSTEGSTPDDD